MGFNSMFKGFGGGEQKKTGDMIYEIRGSRSGTLLGYDAVSLGG